MTSKWKTADGRRIPIDQLDNNHLLNVMHHLIRIAVANKMRTELVYLNPPFGMPRGDMAQDAFDREFDQVMDLSVYDYLPSPLWEDLEEECGRRGLKPPEFPNDAAIGVIVLEQAQKRRGINASEN